MKVRVKKSKYSVLRDSGFCLRLNAIIDIVSQFFQAPHSPYSD
jgi:hypothetical protein